MLVRKTLSCATAVIVSSALALGISAPVSAATTMPPEKQSVAVDPTNEKQQMEELLGVIDQIPNSVLLQGEKETHQWIEKQLSPEIISIGGQVVAQPASFLSCSSFIIGLIAGHALPIAKIMKIKKYMNALGGVKEAIQLMWGASFNYEKMQALGGALGLLAAELAGVAGIKQSCP